MRAFTFLVLIIIFFSSCRKRGTCFNCEVFNGEEYKFRIHVSFPENHKVKDVENIMLKSIDTAQTEFDNVKCKVLSPKEYCK